MIRNMWSMEKIVEKGLKDDAAKYKPDFSVFQPMNMQQCEQMANQLTKSEEHSQDCDADGAPNEQEATAGTDSTEESAAFGLGPKHVGMPHASHFLSQSFKNPTLLGKFDVLNTQVVEQ